MRLLDDKPLRIGSPAHVSAGRTVRCPRCGRVHRLQRSPDLTDDSGELYVRCGGAMLKAARDHWLVPISDSG